MSLLTEGWAIRRNNTCLLTLEVDCGQTRAPFRACCPSGFACPSQWNVACCTIGTNCTETIAHIDKPPCSNATWDLFDNNGFFCCEGGSKAYDRGGSNVCVGSSGSKGVEKGDVELKLVREGVDPATFKPSPSSTSFSASLTPISLTFSATSTSTTSSTPAPDDPSKSNTGAIVGGTLGGVALIAMIAAILFFLRRRRRRNATPHPHGGDSNPYLLQDQHHGQSYGGESVKYMYEADGSVVAVHEADGSLDHGLVARELPGSQARINELAGHGEAKELPARETLVELPAPDTIR